VIVDMGFREDPMPEAHFPRTPVLGTSVKKAMSVEH
jgi:hypothetical protein